MKKIEYFSNVFFEEKGKSHGVVTGKGIETFIETPLKNVSFSVTPIFKEDEKSYVVKGKNNVMQLKSFFLFQEALWYKKFLDCAEILYLQYEIEETYNFSSSQDLINLVSNEIPFLKRFSKDVRFKRRVLENYKRWDFEKPKTNPSLGLLEIDDKSKGYSQQERGPLVKIKHSFIGGTKQARLKRPLVKTKKFSKISREEGDVDLPKSFLQIERAEKFLKKASQKKNKKPPTKGKN